MSINLHHPLWKEFLKYLGWILLFVFLWFRGCSGTTPTTQNAKVIVPEVKAKFEAKKPSHEPIAITPQLKKGETVFTENPINEKLIAENEKLKLDYAKANDSIKKFSFNKAIQLNKFSSKFEDENLILNINGIVQGEVKEITPNYVIKEKKVEVPVKVKETVFRLLAGGSVGINEELNQAAYKLDLNFQNRKGDVISVEYLKTGSQTFWMGGYKKSIFTIKR